MRKSSRSEANPKLHYRIHVGYSGHPFFESGGCEKNRTAVVEFLWRTASAVGAKSFPPRPCGENSEMWSFLAIHGEMEDDTGRAAEDFVVEVQTLRQKPSMQRSAYRVGRRVQDRKAR